VQRALREIGRSEEALINLGFFHRAWRESGIASYYEVATLGSTAYGYHGVELPHYLVLMVRDAERLAGVDGADYWDMVKGCLDEAAVPWDGLQPMNGDETWLLAAPVRELDALLDNTWLLIASADYGLKLAERVGDAESQERYRWLASQARGALFRFQPRLGEAEWYAVGRGGGSLDVSLCPAVLARGAVLDVLPATDPYLSAGLITSWNRLAFDRGVRGHPRSATIDGGTPGYVLSAAAESPACDFTGELARRVLDFCSATGCVWEFHDLHDPAWGGEKRRLWDSAVVLMGLAHALFDARESGDGVEFQPRTDLPVPAPAPEPPFDAEELLADAGAALILHDGSEQHAARIARELLRHRNEQFAVSQHRGAPPDDHSAIIISRRYAPTGWRRTLRGYWVRDWEGPPHLWIRNTDHAYADTDPLLTDLLSLLTPQRATPLPFPDANYDLVSRFGEPPSGEALVSLLPRPPASGESAALDLSGGDALVETDGCRAKARTAVDRERRLLKLTVSAEAAGPDPAMISVRLPAGWWVVYARDMTGRWDRVQTPVSELRLPTGGIELLYTFPPSETPVHLTFDLARLSVKSL
jgi:hypothetical protein